MFERFTIQARAAVTTAEAVAAAAGAHRLTDEHLLVGIVRTAQGGVRDVLVGAGVDATAVERRLSSPEGGGDELDAAALASLGIDLDRVRSRADELFGPGALSTTPPRRRRGHVPFTPEAKRVLEAALREAVRRGDRRLDGGHLLLAVLRRDDAPAYALVADLVGGPEAVGRLATSVERALDAVAA